MTIADFTVSYIIFKFYFRLFYDLFCTYYDVYWWIYGIDMFYILWVITPCVSDEHKINWIELNWTCNKNNSLLTIMVLIISSCSQCFSYEGNKWRKKLTGTESQACNIWINKFLFMIWKIFTLTLICCHYYCDMQNMTGRYCEFYLHLYRVFHDLRTLL